MKKIITILFLSIIPIANAFSQNITEVFLTMPDDIITGLDAESRDRLVADPEDTLMTKVETTIYEGIQRIAISDDFVSINTSTIGNTQIKILPLINHSKIICVVKTICDDICDSDIRFYTTDWQPITGSELFPQKEDIINRFIKEDTDKSGFEYKNAIAPVDMIPVKLILSPNDSNIVAEFHIKDYLSKDDYKLLQPYLNEEVVTLEWNKTSYK